MQAYRDLAVAVVLYGLSFFLSGIPHMVVLALALMLLAKHIGFLTEEIAGHVKASVAALLSTTLGNVAELILGAVALTKGMGEVVKASITGSIVGNLLLVLGVGAVVASLAKRRINFRTSMDLFILSTLLPMLMLLAPSFMPFFHEQEHVGEVSFLIAAFFLLFYALFLRKVVEEEEREKHKATLSLPKAVGLLVLSTLFLVLSAEAFVEGLEKYVEGYSELFLGAIVLGLVGNVAEHLYAIGFAQKGRFQLLLHATLGSTIQVVMFVLPVLYFFSLYIGQPMPLYFTPLEAFALAASAILVWAIIEDGKVRGLEGVGLIGMFLLIAMLFYYAP